VAFAFMVGTASSKMFEGWLFILLQRPVRKKMLHIMTDDFQSQTLMYLVLLPQYDIGDRIHVSNIEQDTR